MLGVPKDFCRQCYNIEPINASCISVVICITRHIYTPVFRPKHYVGYDSRLYAELSDSCEPIYGLTKVEVYELKPLIAWEVKDE